ncbi:MAG: acylphosphatase [Eubacterium sp.]|jgi:Acylphosphatases|nr:acylphosphatase [Eubacterium sp.]
MRRYYRFFGRVQGVGFRYRARQAADSLGVTGWVTNLYDGSVEMEAQGKEEELDRLVQMIQGSPYIDVADLTVKDTREIPEERSFRIR